MKGQQQVSPKKYIETRARTLPVFKCWITPDWQETRLADVIVTRRHTNGHLTTGVYLVDLLCLGIKDTFFFFNEEEEELTERLQLNSGMLTEIEYSLAHNIIYAGHDFALEYDIHPHKDFQTTKFILEEDDDIIPLIDIPTGDENGYPHLLVSSEYNYKPALEKLKKNAGEGNYTFTLKSSRMSDMGEDDWNVENEEEEEWNLDDIEPDFLEFSDVKNASAEKLEKAFNSDNRSALDKHIVSIEMILRTFGEFDPDWDRPEEEIAETEDYQSFENSFIYNDSNDDRLAKDLKQLNSDVGPILEKSELEEQDREYLFLKFEEYTREEVPAFILLNIMPAAVVESRWDMIRQRFATYPPLVQLALTIIVLSLSLPMPEAQTNAILNSAHIEEAFLGYQSFNDLHYKTFWMAKALWAMQKNDVSQLQHYHSLLTMNDLPPGQLKLAYVFNFSHWLIDELKRRTKEES